MGGSGGGGGGGYFQSTPEKAIDKLRESEAKSQDAAYEAKVNQLLGELLSRFNNRDQKAITRHVEEIIGALGKEVKGRVDLMYGGSVAKHTYVDGFSDVDALVYLDNCELADLTPSEAQKYVVNRLRERFPKTPVTPGGLAVTVEFSDIDIQLIPAITCRGRTNISDEAGTRWTPIDPKGFTTALTRVNQAVGHKVVPTIKLAKGIIANLPEKHRVSGYHVESLAIEVFRHYSGPQQMKTMLKKFFTEAPGLVLQPIRDRTGQSLHVDEYLGNAGSVPRRIVSGALDRVARRMRNADGAGSSSEWEGMLLGES